MIPWVGLREGTAGPLRPLRRGGRPRWVAFLELPLMVLVAAIVAVAIKALVAQAFVIPSASMEPQLRPGDRVVVSRLAYDLHAPRRGDVVVFDDPQASRRPSRSVVDLGRDALVAVGVVGPQESELIKRTIGLPGETVEARGGSVVIDGRALHEPYLPAGTWTADFGPTVVPDGHVFVMGDNRGNSLDSRSFGPVPVDSIVGRALVRIWPPGRLAYL